jgi:NADPH-dependent 2,4-dienoyl-CoA reductase/sulfur reductase-like enzyme
MTNDANGSEHGMKQYKYLIIGGGITADAAVKGIREVDESGTVGIISAEPDPPYARPPLSKDLWTNDKKIDDIWCGTEQKGAEIISATRALSLDPGKQEVTDDHGEVYRYERLLLATGGTPRRLPVGDDEVIYFRTCGDYRLLRAICEDADRFAVLGGGFIGAEIAAALKINDKQVTMVFPEAAICGRLLPSEFAAALSRYYEDRGVTIVAGRKPSAIDAEKGVLGVHLENGHMFSVDGIVAGIGIEPNTKLADDAGFDVDNGIIVDEQLRTKHPHVFAAGDVANFANRLLGKRLRVEHEDNALTMGRTAGRNMAGEEQPYHHLPYFYSDLFDIGYEAIGETDPSLETITALREPEEKGCIFYMKGERVRGVVFWNVFDKVDAGRELIAAPGPHDQEGLRAWEKERLAE